MKVKIIKASKASYWYSNYINEIFEVEHYDFKDYKCSSLVGLFIAKEDCEIIENIIEFDTFIKDSEIKINYDSDSKIWSIA